MATRCLVALCVLAACGDDSAPADGGVVDASIDALVDASRDSLVDAPALDDATTDSSDASVSGPLRAFPTAVGAGAEITGGRGGDVYHVTTLDDSGPGSLRDAVSESNRTIVFDVSGVIELASRLTGNAENITIAGQTAPGAGITVAGNTFMIFESDNWIVRHLRFRGSGDDQDAFTVLNSSRIYIDHCSMSFGLDEAGTMTGSTSTTLGESTMAHCLLAESKTGTILKGDTGYTSYMNLYYNISHRFPNLASNGTGAFDVINNVAWNYSNRLVRANDAIDLVHQGNYSDLGTTPLRNDRINQYQYFGADPRIYSADNVIVAVNTQDPNTHTASEMNADNRLMWSFFDGTQEPYVEDERLPTEWFQSASRDLLGVAPDVFSAEEALTRVLADVGANRRLEADGTVTSNSDTYDRAWITNVQEGVYESALDESEYTVAPVESESRPMDFDTDRDGMPNVWEIAQGFDPDVDDHADDADGDGYENLEEYLDRVDL